MQWDECKSFLRVDELLETRTMNTEKLRELDKKFLDRVRRYLGVTMIDLETLENDLMYAVERLAAIIAEEEAREPVGYVAQEDLRWLHAGAGVEIRETLMASRSYADRSVPLYTQPPSAGGEK